MKLRTIVVAVWILLLVTLTTWFVTTAAEAGLLLWGAPLLPLFPILGLCWLKPKEELLGWALFTVWLGSTYLASGLLQEQVAFAVIIALALAGYFRSPWFLVAAWYLHIAWDFIPRELPELLQDLPLACLLFDGIIGSYLAWRTVRGRWDEQPRA